MAAKLDVLVSGAGIAGLTAAHFLLREGHHVTIVEHADDLRVGGQSVDVRGHGLTVLKKMKTAEFDIESAVWAKRTQEKGLRFVDAADRSCAEFPVDEGTSFTGEIEILRGELVRALYKSVSQMQHAEVLFSTYITSIEQTREAKVPVRLKSLQSATSDGSEPLQYDVVIAADGIRSATRRLAFGGIPDPIKPLNQWSCWFSVPRIEGDDQWARWYNAIGGRMILVRPDQGDLTRVSLWQMTRDATIEEDLMNLLDADVNTQKRYWSQRFQDAGWEADRVVQGLENADDFYMQKIAQVQLDHWSQGRVVLLGDAACCPSPISGMGVTTAMTGAYTLAGELNSSSTEPEVAFKAYEDKMRPFVKVAQQLAPGTPGAANPDSAFGIRLLYLFLGFIAWTKLYKLFGSSVNPPSQAMTLPTY